MTRTIAKRILLRAPNYQDVRILIGGKNVWRGNYEQAEDHFMMVLEEGETCDDIYNAYAENEICQVDYETSLQTIEQKLEHHLQSKSFLGNKIKNLGYLVKKK